MLFTKRSLLSILLFLVLSLTIVKSGRISLFNHNGLNMRAAACEEKGFGINGITLKDIKEIYKQIAAYSPKQNIDDFEKFMKPLIDKVGNLTKNVTNNIADFALGDFTYDKIKKFDKMSCDVVPFDDDQKLGVIAFNINSVAVPCAAPNALTACFAFSRCGTFAFSFNAGAPKCLATATGVGAAVAPFLGVLSGVGFAYSYNNKIPLEVSIAAYNKATNKFEEKTMKLKGNIYFTMQFDLAGAIFPDSATIKGKKLSEIFTVKGAANIMVDYGKVFSAIRTQVENWIKGANKSTLLRDLKNSGAEVAIEGNAEMTLNLKTLTDDFLPDLKVGTAKANVVASLGNGNSGITKGLYLAFTAELSIIQSFYETLLKTLGKILNVFGINIPQNANLTLKVHLGLSFTDEVIGFRISGNLGTNNSEMNCLYRFSDKKFSCAALQVIFTAVKEGAQWMVQKVGSFFSDVGDKIVVAFQDAKSWVVTNIVDPIGRWINTPGTPRPCKADEDQIFFKCYKKNPRRNYYKLYLRTQRMRMNKKRRLF